MGLDICSRDTVPNQSNVVRPQVYLGSVFYLDLILKKYKMRNAKKIKNNARCIQHVSPVEAPFFYVKKQKEKI